MSEEEDSGKGCFWIMAGVALLMFAFFAGSALMRLVP